MHSCLYEGRVQHVRHEPVEHRFGYRLAMAYVDLDELELIAGSEGYLSSNRFAPASFLEIDHLGSFGASSDPPKDRSLACTVRDCIEEQTEHRPKGPIRLLTQLRYFGHYFSPLNLFFCFSEEESRVEYVVAEVSNTPWQERHVYVLHPGNQIPGEGALRYRHRKSFHVSPFMGMDATYQWQLTAPTKTLVAQIKSQTLPADALAEVDQSGMFVTPKREQLQRTKSFRATMVLHRQELSRRSVRSMLFRYPLMNAKVLAAIYWQALLLWKKKCPFFPHP